MTDLMDLYGTEQPPEPERLVRAGRVEFALRGGALSHLRVDGRELVRQVAFLARDRDWGTLVPEVGPVEEDRGGEGRRFRYRLTFANGGGRLPVDVTVRVSEGGLDLEAAGRADGAFETNRTGFTVLHPITGQAGAPVTVRHADGQSEEACFPDLIAPWQPFKEIAAITHRVAGLACRCAFEGDVFEMEDQRQWGDASFKTYNRPLERPWPYLLADGEEVRQAVRLRWDAAPPAEARPAGEGQARAAFPETSLLLTADQARRATGRPSDLEVVALQRLLAHVDATSGDLAGQFGAFAALQREVPHLAFDLEYIGAFDRDPAEELPEAAAAMRAAGLVPASVMVCPAADRQSTPPGSAWPACPPLEAVHRAARAAFDAPRMGGGMATFFPELNRKRPPVELLDFVTHSLCPIVHDASDRAVMETLEAVPHITRSARAILGGREYRIGPSTIAMRHNAYGSRTAPNPDNLRVCMADCDPRHGAAFGAAYTVGLAAALAPAGIAVWTPAELYGSRGLFAPDGTPFPLARAIAQLARCAGQEVVSTSAANGCAELRLSGAVFRANLTADLRNGLPPYGWSMDQ